MLCAHRRAGQTQRLFWRRISRSEIRKIVAAEKEAAKARVGKNSFPPTPFLFARPSVAEETGVSLLTGAVYLLVKIFASSI